MGSEFAFEDLSSFEIGKYHYRYLRDEKLDGQNTVKLEYYPTYQHSGYTKLISWIDQQEYRVLKTVFYDRKGDHLKTLTYQEYQLYMGRYWQEHKMRMVNHQSEKNPDLLWNEYQFQTGLNAIDFSLNSLKRIR